MHDRIENGANLLASHCFQFDFLNDDFSKLPADFFQVTTTTEKRKKLIIYINPPYAEATSTATKVGTRENKTEVATQYNIHKTYSEQLGKARNEVFALFLIRIYMEITDCKIGNFSTLKTINAPNFKTFREFFQAKFEKGFIIPSYTFDNVNGDFPIAFQVWDTEIKEQIVNTTFDVY